MPQQTDRLWSILTQSNQIPWTLKHQEFYWISALIALCLVVITAYMGWRSYKRGHSALPRQLVMWLLTLGSFVIITVVAVLVWLLPDSLLLWFLGVQYIAQLHPAGVSHLIDLLYFGQYLVVWNLLLALGFMITIFLLPCQNRLLTEMRGENAVAGQEGSAQTYDAPRVPTESAKGSLSQPLSPLTKPGVDEK